MLVSVTITHGHVLIRNSDSSLFQHLNLILLPKHPNTSTYATFEAPKSFTGSQRTVPVQNFSSETFSPSPILVQNTEPAIDRQAADVPQPPASKATLQPHTPPSLHLASPGAIVPTNKHPLFLDQQQQLTGPISPFPLLSFRKLARSLGTI